MSDSGNTAETTPAVPVAAAAPTAPATTATAATAAAGVGAGAGGTGSAAATAAAATPAVPPAEQLLKALSTPFPPLSPNSASNTTNNTDNGDDTNAAAPAAPPSAVLPLPELRRLVMRVPQLTTLLTGPTRLHYYLQVLYPTAEDRARLAALPTSFAALAGRGTAAHRAVARRLLEALGGAAASGVSEEELVGLAVRLADDYGAEAEGEAEGKEGGGTAPEAEKVAGASAATAALDEGVAAVAEAMAALVREGGRAAPGGDAVRLLFALVDAAAESFLLPADVLPYRRSHLLFLRLFLQYHDPELSVHLDQHGADAAPLQYAAARRLFALPGRPPADAWAVLDWLLLVGDDLVVPFAALAAVLARRRELLAVTDAAELRRRLAVDEDDGAGGWRFAIPQQRADPQDAGLADGRSVALVPVSGGKALMQNASLLLRQTPASARAVLLSLMGGSEVRRGARAVAATETYFSSLVTLAIDGKDLEASFPVVPRQHAFPPLEYVIVDCRSQRSFDYAHLPTAVYAGDCVGFDDGKLAALLERLRPLRGTPLALFGTGRPDVEQEVNLLRLIALQLVRAGFPFVSVVLGGFRGVMPLLRANRLRVIVSAELAAGGGSGGSDPDGLDFAQALAGLRLPEGLTNGAAEALGRAGDFLQARAAAIDAETVKARAEELRERAGERAAELRARAGEGLGAASAWGWGVLQQVQERWAAATAGEEEQQGDGSGAAPTASGAASASAQTGAGGRSSGGGSDGSSGANTRAAAAAGGANAFSLGDADDDDDLGLITAMPVRPLRNPAAPPAADANAATTTGASVANTTSTGAAGTTTSGPAAAGAATTVGKSEVDKEFEDLFGDV